MARDRVRTFRVVVLMTAFSLWARTDAVAFDNWPVARGTPEGTAVVSHAGPATQPAVIWSFKSAGPVTGSALGSMTCTPVVYDGTVYWGSDDGTLYALRAADGTKVWQFTPNEKPKDGGEVLGSAAVTDKHAFVSHFGKGVFCIDRATGKQVWRKEFVLTIGSPVVVENKVIFGNSNNLTCYDVSGKTRFSFSPPAGVVAKGSVFGVVTANATQVCFTSDNGHAYSVRFEDEEEAWDRVLGNLPERGAVAISNNEALIVATDAQEVRCLDLKTGKDRWTKAFDKQDNLLQPAVGSDYVVVATRTGKVVRLNRTNGEAQWTVETNVAGCQSPIVCKDVIYLAAKRKVVALDVATGKTNWACDLPAGAGASPSVADGKLFVTGIDGTLYVLGNKSSAK